MRIASAFYTSQSIQNLQARQTQLTETQQQMTSGKRVAKASDDPADAARAERALALLKRNEATLRAVDSSRNSMTLTESALGDASDMVQSAREALVALGNGSYTDSDRAAQVLRLTEMRDQLLSVANRQDANGRYLFGAAGSTTAPFQKDAAGVVSYSGPTGQAFGASGVDEPLPLSMDGASTWLMTPAAASDVFEVLKTAIDALSVTAPTTAQVKQAVSDGLAGLDVASATLGAARTNAGEVLNRLDGVQARLTSLNVTAEGDRSNATDLDLLEATSRFQTQQTGYDAALKTYSSVQRMSLFQYINA